MSTKTTPSRRMRRHDAAAVRSGEPDQGFPLTLKGHGREAMVAPSRRGRHPRVSPLPASASRAGLSPGQRPNNPKEVVGVGDANMTTLAGAATTGRRDAPARPTTTRHPPRCSAGTRAAMDRFGQRRPRLAATSTKWPSRRGGWALPPGKTPEPGQGLAAARTGGWWPAREAGSRRTGLKLHRRCAPSCKSASYQERRRWWLEKVQPSGMVGTGAHSSVERGRIRQLRRGAMDLAGEDGPEGR